ncbi:Chromosome partition protein Smc [Methylobacterium frigidaeris]|uniref:Chromosome partition protein Smc n=3 Tax=Methylobacterium frigidaeris TaxID=2038277 RepID=A0AA37H5Z5_9HYPH|nr:Chromosome partition protein Smc [Methylobacterium frigidaeris]
MFAALGFLAASLCALLILPALNARAERLTRRRLEALYPMSIVELTAEKDHLRAEFAVRERQLERRVEEAQAARRAEMEEMGRRTVRIGMLTQEIERRDAHLAAIEQDLAAARGNLAQVQGELAEARTARAAAEEAMRALEGPYQRALAELASLRGEVEASRSGQAEAEAARGVAEERVRAARGQVAAAGESVASAAREQIQALEDALADLTTRHAAEVEADRAEIARLQQALREMSRATASPPLSAEITAQNAALERRIAEVADALMQAQGRSEPRLPQATPLPTPAAAG